MQGTLRRSERRQRRRMRGHSRSRWMRRKRLMGGTPRDAALYNPLNIPRRRVRAVNVNIPRRRVRAVPNSARLTNCAHLTNCARWTNCARLTHSAAAAHCSRPCTTSSASSKDRLHSWRRRLRCHHPPSFGAHRTSGRLQRPLEISAFWRSRPLEIGAGHKRWVSLCKAMSASSNIQRGSSCSQSGRKEQVLMQLQPMAPDEQCPLHMLWE